MFRAVFPPALPSLVETPPVGPDWIHEIKYDGYRTQLVIEAGRCRAFTRNGHDWSGYYAPIVAAAEQLGCRSAVIDGELAVQDEKGVTDFAALRRTISREPHRLVFFAFDLLQLDGEDLRRIALEERRARLQSLLGGAEPRLCFSEALVGSGLDFFRAADAAGLEGIVSKRLGSAYPRGRASSWVKTKAFTTGSFEVIGVEKSRDGVPVALLGSPGEPRRFSGSAFIALKAEQRERFWRYVECNQAEGSPVKGMRRAGALWLKPGLLAEVRHLRGEEMLRHATMRGLVQA